MKQVNGPGSIVSGISILGAAVCAECIPLMLGCVAVAIIGVGFDMLMGYYSEIKKSPRRAGARSRRKTKYVTYSIQRNSEKVNISERRKVV